MNCPKCGENYSEELATCPKCGASLEGGAAEKEPDTKTEAVEVTDTKHEAAGGLDEKTMDAVQVGSVEEAVGKLAAAQIADEASRDEREEAAGDAAPEDIAAAQAEANAEGKSQTFDEWEQEHREYFDYIDNLRKKPDKKSGFFALAKLPKYKKAILGACALLLVVAIGFGGWYLSGTMKLKKALQNDWALVEDTDDFFIRVLSFTDKDVTFTFESRLAWLNNTIAIYEYTVVSPTKVKFETGEISKTLKIELSDDGNIMIVTPSLTDDKTSQTWKVVEKDRLHFFK